MNNKTFKAQITVMAALSMTIIFSLICTCVRSASDCFYNTQIKEACMLSVEGAFSAYHNDMLSEYDILLLQYILEKKLLHICNMDCFQRWQML